MAAFTDFPMPNERIIKCGDTTVAVMPEINLVSYFQVGPWQILYRASETGNVKRWGLPLMIPNFARLQDGIFQDKHTTLPIHGFGRNLSWTVLEHKEDTISLQLVSSEATRANYPYEFTFTCELVAGDGTLTYTLTMENRSDEVMPIAPGFHPYFALAQDDKARLIADGPEGFSVDAFRWDTNPPDNYYPFAHSARFQFPQHGTLTIEELASNDHYSLKEMQVWSEPVTAPDHEFICLEPIVAHWDGLNRPQDRIEIAPQEEHRIILRLHAQPLVR
ncbi:hypothetical protein [Ktedonospora formicarum]|uniref:Aldose 1-epimerase n=1 Tax=Ktedonospora formicarum TaxID=2778364 RepID=A0A8J3MQC8_9CHLR|nr:hypothetical protein [Ktedonospora formicarum]GHO43855.1 hypothetical protein KSX_20180 [Ktedonospora formicarum]